MIWLGFLGVALTVIGLIGWRSGIDSRMVALSGAAVMAGMVGYGIQGQPQLSGAPIAKRPMATVLPSATEDATEDAAEDAAFVADIFAGLPRGPLSAKDTEALGKRLGPISRWPAPAPLLAEILIAQGRSGLAVSLMQIALVDAPNDVVLWVALGNGLVAHGGGVINSAAMLAFSEAARRDPDHPAPPFFTGLALAQSGDLAATEAIWSSLLERSSADTTPSADDAWRTDLTRRLKFLRRQRALIRQADDRQIADRQIADDRQMRVDSR